MRTGWFLIKSKALVKEQNHVFTEVVGEQDLDFPRFPAESLDELHRNLREIIEMLLEDGDPQLDAEFVGTQSITVPA